MNKIDELTLSCVVILDKLIDLYKDSKISKEEFEENSRLKAIFLINNINNITDQELKFSMYKTLNSYASCSSMNGRKNSTYNIPR